MVKVKYDDRYDEIYYDPEELICPICLEYRPTEEVKEGACQQCCSPSQ